MNKKHIVAKYVLLLSLCINCHAFAESDMTWFDANDLRIDGKGWENTPTPYCRLPKGAEGKVPSVVWGLSKQSAGLIVHFNTNSANISLNWTVTGELSFPHMPATGVSGVDLYQKSDKDGKWYFLHNGRPVANENTTTAWVGNPEGKVREYKVYLPLYNGVETLKIGISKGTKFKQPPALKKKPIVYYGTSIAQGACASRPGMAFTAMLERMLCRPVVNLGFSGSGRMEAVMAETISEIDAEVFVIDCLWNISSETDEVLEQRITKLIKIIRGKHAETPILFVGQSHLAGPHPTVKTKVLLQALKKNIDTGINGLHFLEGDDLVGKDRDGTVDGCHPNDLGMRRHADVLAPAIKKLTDSKKKN